MKNVLNILSVLRSLLFQQANAVNFVRHSNADADARKIREMQHYMITAGNLFIISPYKHVFNKQVQS